MAVQDTASGSLYWFSDCTVTPDRVHYDHYFRNHRDNDTPIVIDNGSWQCRAGWATEDHPLLVFQNAVARMRGKKGEPDYAVVGNEIANVELVRSTLKNQFDHNIISNFSVQEQILDHVFLHLGLGDEGRVHHPVVVTEPVCNLASCRAAMSELLFEGYGIPQVSYGVDCLFNLYHSSLSRGVPVTDALVVCSGYQTTHVVPVLDGRFEPSHCKRINVGGWHSAVYLQRLLQLKQPWLQMLVTPTRALELLYSHCYVAEDYEEELLGAVETRTVQLPYSLDAGEGVMDPLQREEKDQQRRQRAREQLLRLNQRKREEKIAELENQLEGLIHLQQLAPVLEQDEYQLSLEEAGLPSMESLLQAIQSVQEALEGERSRLEATLQRLHGGQSEGTAHSEAADLQWVQTLQMRKKELMEQRKARQQLRQELSKRRSAASQNRMRIITQLAEDTSKGSKQEDTFGMDDDDWNVYLTISKTAGDSDSEREEAELMEINKLLGKHDPAAKKKAGGRVVTTTESIASHYQLHLGVERFRSMEVVFQPSMVGVDQCGLVAAVELVLASFPDELQQRLVNNVLITGGNTVIPNFEQRMERELRAIRPFQSSFFITASPDKVLGGWKGAADWARSGGKEGWITRACYHECGADYLREHVASNHYIQPQT